MFFVLVGDVPVLGSPRSLDLSCIDGDIRTRVGTFVHKHFGQSKRISEKDKKAMERWISEQVYLERKRLQKTVLTQAEQLSGSDCVDGKSDEPDELEQMQEKLDLLYGKLRLKNADNTGNNNDNTGNNNDNTGHNNDNTGHNNDNTGHNNDDCEEACITPGVASFPMLEVEIDRLLERLDQVESTVGKAHVLLGDRARRQSLCSHIQELQYDQSQQEKELMRERQKIEKMLTELYDYSKSINKLEIQRNQTRVQLENRFHEIQRLMRHNEELSLKCRNLETINNQHSEKEKTLEDLRRMVKDLQASKESVVDENINYRNKFMSETQLNMSPRQHRRTARGLPLGATRRGVLLDSNTTISNRRSRVSMNNKRKTFPSPSKQ